MKYAKSLIFHIHLILMKKISKKRILLLVKRILLKIINSTLIKIIKHKLFVNYALILMKSMKFSCIWIYQKITIFVAIIAKNKFKYRQKKEYAKIRYQIIKIKITKTKTLMKWVKYNISKMKLEYVTLNSRIEFTITRWKDSKFRKFAKNVVLLNWLNGKILNR